MDNNLKFIVEYQNVDKELKAIEDGLKKSEEAQKFAAAKKFLSSVPDSLSALDNKAKSLINEYSAILERAKKLKEEAKEFEATVNSFESEDELNYFRKKFQETCDLLASEEAKLNEITKETEECAKEFNRLRAQTAKMQDQYKEYGPKFQEIKNSKKGEVLALKAKLAKIAENIDKDLMLKYETKRNDKKFPILFEVDVTKKGQCNCPACGTALPIYALDEIAQGKIKECESCRRLLYSATVIR